jgi:serpin B
VRLPYEGEHLGMYIFLPDTNSSPEKLLSLMSGDVWRRITKPGFSQKEGVLMLPKFKLESNIELTKTLPEMGMRTAFDMRKANFSGIARLEDRLYISRAVQKTFVEVKEEGTEAAAVTGIGVVAASASPLMLNPFEMIVERPFIFLIEDDQTGTILFMGLIFNPSTE